MALPWLIGGVIFAGIAAYKAFSDDDSSSSSSSDSDAAERHRRENAEQERKERERSKKLEAAKEEFQKQGRIFGQNLAEALPSELVAATSREGFELDFDLKKGRLQFDMEDASRRDLHLFSSIDGLEAILTQRASHKTTIENLAIFSELYKPEFQYGAELQKKRERIKRLDEGIQELQEVKKLLMKMASPRHER